MAASPYATVQDLVDALGEPAYLAIFDEGGTLPDRAAVDGSSGVALCLRRAHAQVSGRLPGIYSQLPAEQPDDTHVSDLLRDAELAFAVVFAYRRHPEWVRTYGAGPNGPLWQEALDNVERLQTGVLRVPQNDNPPEPAPENIGGIVYDQGPRMLTDRNTGESTSGDF